MSNVQPYLANIQPFEIDLNLLKENFLDPNKINKKQGYKKLTKRILGKSECPLKHQQPDAHTHACTHAHQLNVIVSSATTYMQHIQLLFFPLTVFLITFSPHFFPLSVGNKLQISTVFFLGDSGVNSNFKNYT